ncbi:MAG: OmpW family protein [Acidobacteria bacterium]|jgi:outer membrane protein|nr:OmpW family protein [Acidobacteriota bacterium]
MKTVFGVALLAIALVPSVALAQEGSLMIRARGVYIGTADKSDAIGALGVPADAITVSKKLIPEVDITYFLGKHVAAELILTYPQKHDVEVSGTGIGSFKHLPPVLSLQYHFAPEATVRPYVGVGANLTIISSVDLAVPGVGALDLESTSVGVAAQGGLDIKLGPRVFLNADVKYVTLGSDVMLAASGTTVSAVKINPWLIGFGLGYRF